MKVLILIFTFSMFNVLAQESGGTSPSRSDHCVRIGRLNHCPPTGGSATCPFNRGRCRLQTGGDHDWVQDYGYGGVEASVEEGLRRMVSLDHFRDAYAFLTAPRTEEGDLNTPNPECFANVIFEQGLRPLAGIIWNGNADDPNLREFIDLNCGGGFRYENLRSVVDTVQEYEEMLDPMQEELAYQTAFDDIKDFTTCQARFFNELTPGKPERRNMINIAYSQFSPIKNKLEDKKEELDELTQRFYGERYSRTVDRCRQIVGDVQDMKGARGSCSSQNDQLYLQEPRIVALMAEISRLEEELDQLMSRVPLGNRGTMQTGLIELARRPGRVSRADFGRVYGTKLNEMINDTSDMVSEIMQRTRIRPNDPSKVNYCIDRTMKRNLQRSEQLKDSMASRGLEGDLDQFLLRANNRYGVASEIGAELLLLPLSFGGYGLARLGAGLAVRGARLARTGAALQRATRAGLLGVEAADWTAVAAAIQRDCIEESNQFYDNIPANGACNPLQEIEQVYNESSLMNCATSWLVPAAAAGYGRLATSASVRAGDEIVEAAADSSNSGRAVASLGNDLDNAADDVVEEVQGAPIVVTGRRDTSNDYFQDGRDLDVSDALAEREIFVGLRMSDNQLASLSDADRVSLFMTASGRTLTNGQANRILDFVNDADGILTPRIQERVRDYLEDSLGMNSNQIDEVMRRLDNNRFFELPTDQLVANIKREFRNQIGDLPAQEADALALKIAQARKAGVSERDIRNAVKNRGDGSCSI
ncbi:MAG: hypothetical protein CME62_04075 [Halobacteriovoraceae bacterium]|nr:hypothetical protein [Halobacteriovoraceae bacterium]